MLHAKTHAGGGDGSEASACRHSTHRDLDIDGDDCLSARGRPLAESLVKCAARAIRMDGKVSGHPWLHECAVTKRRKTAARAPIGIRDAGGARVTSDGSGAGDSSVSVDGAESSALVQVARPVGLPAPRRRRQCRLLLLSRNGNLPVVLCWRNCEQQLVVFGGWCGYVSEDPGRALARKCLGQVMAGARGSALLLPVVRALLLSQPTAPGISAPTTEAPQVHAWALDFGGLRGLFDEGLINRGLEPAWRPLRELVLASAPHSQPALWDAARAAFPDAAQTAFL